MPPNDLHKYKAISNGQVHHVLGGFTTARTQLASDVPPVSLGANTTLLKGAGLRSEPAAGKEVVEQPEQAREHYFTVIVFLYKAETIESTIIKSHDLSPQLCLMFFFLVKQLCRIK